jgi:chitin disaccharide deacetylase
VSGSGPDPIRLVVRGDDFGMCHAVNEGIERAFTEGIVTTASTMAPCPWFGEAIEIAEGVGIPLGAHQTLTCEWDYFRWRPLTNGRSLVGDDGTFRPSVELAQQHVQQDEVVSELLAQVARFRSAGVSLDYLDHHMGSTLPAAYAEVAELTGIPFLYSDEVRRGFVSISQLSPRDAAGKKEWMLSYLSQLVPGAHLLVCHPAVDSSEVRSLTGPDSEPYRWAAEYRLSDLDVLVDPDVKGLIGELAITLCSLPEALSGA